jgi:hypothetical protein
MKEMFLFIFFLIPYLIKAIIIQPVTVGYSEITDLKTTILEETYFYMQVTPQKYGNLFFFLNDTQYSLTEKEIKYYVSLSTVNETLINKVKDQFRTIEHYKDKVGKSYKEYYYRYSMGPEFWGKDKYLVIKYKGENSSGSLKVRSSFDDLYDLYNKKLTSLHIVLIVAGCIIFVGILSTVLVCVLKKKKQNVDLGTIDPRPLVRDTTASTNLMTIN